MKQRIEALTATRAIAALLVVVFHYGCTVFPFNLQEHFFRQGNLAVGYFFVLSGFVMYLSYANKGVVYGDFIKRRVARIWPLYVFAILLSAGYPLFQYFVRSGSLPDRFGTALILNLSLLQAHIPGFALTVNSPGWSLSVEMFFYLLFPLLLPLCKSKPGKFFALSIVVYIISQVFHLWIVNTNKPEWGTKLHELVYYQPFFHLNQFMLGMCGAMYFKQLKVRLAGLVSILFLALIIVLINYMPGSVSLHNGLLAPLFLLLIVSIASLNRTPLLFPPLVFLGEISYGIYILQEPVHFYFMKWNMSSGHLSETVSFYSYLVLLITLSAICYYLIELPFRRIISGKQPQMPADTYSL